jgi:hypothetical protein
MPVLCTGDCTLSLCRSLASCSPSFLTCPSASGFSAAFLAFGVLAPPEAGDSGTVPVVGVASDADAEAEAEVDELDP